MTITRPLYFASLLGTAVVALLVGLGIGHPNAPEPEPRRVRFADMCQDEIILDRLAGRSAACKKCIEDSGDHIGMEGASDRHVATLAVTCPQHKECLPGTPNYCSCWTVAMVLDSDECQAFETSVAAAMHACIPICENAAGKDGP